MPQLDAVHLLALAAALGWASGLRLYLTVLLVGIAGHWGWIELPPGLQVLGTPLVMGCAAVLAFVEFLADKIPLVDSAWDALHTLIRIPAGAALVAGVVSGWAGDYGNMILVKHGYGMSTRYGHLSRIVVNAGSTVHRGQIIGYVGATGRTTGSHLHYEIMMNGSRINPLNLLSTR